MKNGNKLILPGLIAAGGLAYFLINRNVQRVANNTRFAFKSIDTLKINFSQINLKINFQYINPEPIDVKIKSIFADIFIGKTLAGGVVDFDGKILKGKTNGIISFPITIRNQVLPELLSQLLDGTLNGGTIDGYFDLPTGRVKFKENFKILV
jgi:hypothetical protein